MEEEERAAARPTAGEEKAARTKAREIVVVDVPMSPAIVMATSGVALCLVVLLFSRPLTMSIILWCRYSETHNDYLLNNRLKYVSLKLCPLT